MQPGFLRPIDTDRIARDMKLDSLAESRGKRNLPMSDSAELDNVEQELIQKLHSEWVWQGEEFLIQLRAYADRLVQYSIKTEFERLQLVANDALAQLRAAGVRAEADLGPLREAYVEIRNELARFRDRHRLQRPAYPTGRRWTTFGLMIVLIAVESVLNGFFFAKGSEFGLLGGVGTAIGISLVNVVFSFVVGLFPARWIHHRNFLIKLIGLAFVIAAFTAITGLQGFAAHFREATATVGETAAMKEAIRTLQTTPFYLNDIESFYLFTLGFTFSLFAFWKGYRFDDPYPGYGSLVRRRDDDRDAYSDAHDELFDELEDVKARTVEELQNGIQLLPTYPQTAARIRTERSTLFEQFRGYESSVASATNQLLTRYRDINREHRTTPAPAHFNTAWKLPHEVHTNPETQRQMADGSDTQVDVDGPLAALNKLSKEVLAEYEMLLEKYPHPSKME